MPTTKINHTEVEATSIIMEGEAKPCGLTTVACYCTAKPVIGGKIRFQMMADSNEKLDAAIRKLQRGGENHFLNPDYFRWIEPGNHPFAY